MAGLKLLWQDLMNQWKIKRGGHPAYMIYLMQKIFNVLEDVYSVGTVAEIQEAIDHIGINAGTIFIESGTYDITVPIDIDNCGSIVIYGHGDNTILKPADGITVFNITCCSSLLIKTLKIDASLYTVASLNLPTILVNETLDNVVGFSDVTIEGLNNFGRGIELQSNNCIIDHCNITFLSYGINITSAYSNISNNTTSFNEIGINVGGTYNTITGNVCSSNTTLGIYINSVQYNNISNNICSLNPTGISLNLANNNTISNNTTSSNTFNGIYISGSSYNTLSGNTCENNDSNSAGNTAGIYINGNSDFNTISANSSNNNNNAGAGVAYGIYIAAATCDENVIAANNANNNDIDFMDVGTATTIEYYVQDEEELQDAIDSIGSKAGVINIEGSFTISATIGIDNAAVHGGSYIIQGDGSNSTLTPSGNFSCFIVREARSVIFENFKIAATNLVGTTPAILINENSDNSIFVNNVEIVGAGAAGYGIQIESPNCRIENCNISSLVNGIIPTDEHCIITGNICNSNSNYGIFLNTANYITVSSNICNLNQVGIYITGVATGNLILGNTIEANTADGIFSNSSHKNTFEGNIIDGNITTNIGTDHAGITLSHSDNNIIIGNTIINNVNGGAGEGYGVYIINATSENNIVRSNNISGNDIQWKDIGVNSDFEYRCSTATEIQDAIDSIAAKSGIIIILSIVGGIQLSATIDIDGGGDYIIKGSGIGSLIDCAGDRTAFNITSARSCILQDFKIDANDLTTATMEIINITEAANNSIIVRSVIITGDGTNGYGIEINSDNCIITNCKIDNIADGIHIFTANINGIITNNIINDCVYGIKSEAATNYYNYIISGNICYNHSNYAMYLDGGFVYVSVNENVCYNSLSGFYIKCTFGAIEANISHSNTNYGIMVKSCNTFGLIGNMCYNNGWDGIRLETVRDSTISGNICSENIILNTANGQAGIVLYDNCDRNVISGNVCYSNFNGGAGTGYGIWIREAGSSLNIISGNSLDINDVNYLDSGTNTKLFGDDTVYGIGWNGDKGTATKNAIYDKIEAVIAGAGEANTASNQGAGVGLFWQKLLLDLQFNNLKSENNRLSIALDGVSHDVEFTIVEANIDHNALANYDALRHLLVGAIDHNSLLNYVANRHLLVGELDHDSLLNYFANQHFLENTINLANINEKNHASLTNKNAEANIKHLTDAQLAALHSDVIVSVANVEAVITAELVDGQSIDNAIDALVALENTIAEMNDVDLTGINNEHILVYNSGDGKFYDKSPAEYADMIEDKILHNNLGGIDAGDINHLTDVQVAALHAVLTNLNQLATRVHSDLQNKNTEANIKHLTDAQLAALHAQLTNLTELGTRNHNDLQNIDAADIKHITAAQLGALHTRLHNMNSALDHNANTWIIFYSNAGGNIVELALGADKTVLTSTGVAGVPAFETGAGHEHLEAHITDLDKYTQAAVNALLHTRLHWMNSGSDHVGNPWNIYYTRADGDLIELALGAADTVLISAGAAAIPAFEPFDAKAVQAVEDAGLVLSAGKTIEYDGTPADGTYTGLVMLIDTTGCAIFDAVYVDGINSVAKAQATGIATMPAIGVVVAAGKVLTHGAICSTASWAWAAGAVIYINETVAGELDDAIPALATELVQIMGVATGTDTIHVNPSLDWVVRV